MQRVAAGSQGALVRTNATVEGEVSTREAPEGRSALDSDRPGFEGLNSISFDLPV